MHYIKTALGFEVLQHKNLNLNARQRRLLLLIGTVDFDLLTPQFKQRFASPELVSELIELGLIEPIHSSEHITSSITTSTLPSISEIVLDTDTPNLKPNNKPTDRDQAIPSTLLCSQVNTLPVDDDLSFEQVRELMLDSLKRYCGLMAKQQIQHIQQAQHREALKQCQIQWLTLLQESRMPPQQLNHFFKQVSHALSS